MCNEHSNEHSNVSNEWVFPYAIWDSYLAIGRIYKAAVGDGMVLITICLLRTTAAAIIWRLSFRLWIFEKDTQQTGRILRS